MTTTTNQEVLNSNGGVVNGNFLAKDKLEKELELLSSSLIALSTDRKSSNLKPETEIQLQEKKSICLLKLKKYPEVVEEGYRTIGKRGPNGVIFKCILAALCRMNKVRTIYYIQFTI